MDHSHWPALFDWLHNLPKPVGIFAIDDPVAHDLAGACLAADIAVPDRVAILGVNKDDLICEATYPPVSSVEVDFSRVGYLAARQLDGLLHGDALPDAERVIQVPLLGVVQRLSTNVQAVDDPQLAAAVPVSSARFAQSLKDLAHALAVAGYRARARLPCRSRSAYSQIPADR